MTPHTKAIDDLLSADSTLRRTGFHAVLCTRYAEIWGELKDAINIVPDAFKIEGNDVVCYEVEHTATINAKRLEVYGYLWSVFDFYDIQLRLIVCNIHGHRSEASLQEWHYAKLAKLKKPKSRRRKNVPLS